MKRQSKKAVAAKSKKSTVSKKVNKPNWVSKGKLSVENLKKVNIIASLLYLAQAAVVILLGTAENVSRPVSLNHLSNDTFSTGGESVLVPATRHLFDVNLTALVAAFLLFGAVAHIVVAFWLRKKYEADLKMGVNRFRWLYYCFAESTIMVGLALLVGLYDAASLGMIVGLVVAANLLAFSFEQATRDRDKLLARNTYWLSMLASIIPWLVFGGYLLGSYLYGAADLPAYLWALFASSFVLFALFGFNMKKQRKAKGRWSNYLFTEYVYVKLSVLVNAAVAWQIFFGVLKD